MGTRLNNRTRRHPRLCRRCGKHPAKFQYRGRVRAGDDHDMCFQCFRACRNAQRAQRLKDRDG